MSSKLDTSLDDILKTRRTNTRRGGDRGGRRVDAGRPAPTGPVGGVAKSTRAPKQPKATGSGAPAQETTGKILVSGLPHDVDQTALQEYFATAVGVGRPRKIMLQYGPTGRSLGSATIIFNKHDQAVKATSALNGVKIDNRPVRVEMLVSAANISAATTTSLADRVTQSKKDKPKPATAAKAAPATAGRGRGGREARGRGRGRDGRAAGRERTKKKTVEEMDAEMDDYFPVAEGGNDAILATGAGGAQATAGGDTAMDDEML